MFFDVFCCIIYCTWGDILKKKKSKLKKAVLLLFPLLVAYYIISCFFVNEIFYYNSSKSFMTYVVYGIIILTALSVVIFTITGFKCIKKNKTKPVGIPTGFIFLYI